MLKKKTPKKTLKKDNKILTPATINTQNLIKVNKQLKKETKIIAVTKTLTTKAVESAIQNNINAIGESRIQETEQKFKNFKQRNKIHIHLIGRLQTNKAKKAVQLYDVIQTADSEKIIKKINQEALKINKKQKIFVQINIGKDPNKKGFKETEIKSFCSLINKLNNIILQGIMVILPQKLTNKRKHDLYKRTKKIQEKIKTKITTCAFTSMGMSEDYLEAVKAGATHIRLGTILYGKRK